MQVLQSLVQGKLQIAIPQPGVNQTSGATVKTERTSQPHTMPKAAQKTNPSTRHIDGFGVNV
jgi:hypothetical protein